MHTDHFFVTFSRIAAALAFSAGVLALLGWAFDVAALKSVLPGLATMKANTALAFVLSGIALWMLSTSAPGVRNRIAQACAAAVVLLGGLTLGEYVFSWELGIDQFLADDLAPGSAHPGRMAPTTAANFVLLAAAFLLVDVETRSGRWPAQWLGLAVALSSFIGILGYAYGVGSLYGIQAYSSMALHTALAFLFLSVGFLCARPTRGLIVLASGDDTAGVLIRRLVPAAIVLPSVLGGLRVAGQEAGYYTTAFGTAMFATANVIVFFTLVWWTARSVRESHAQRRKAEDSLRDSETRLRTVFDSALSAVVVIDSTGRITDWNARAEQIFGWTRAEALGRELAATIVPVRFREAHRRGLERFLATGEGPVINRLIELTALRRDGSEFPVELSISPVKSGDAVAFCGFVTDITERKHAENALVAERMLLRTLIDTLPDVVFTKDTAGRFTMCNAAELKHVRLTRDEELVGKSVFDLYERELAEIYHADDLRALSGQPVLNSEEPGVDSAGNRRWYLTTKVPLHDRDGKVSGIVGISRDITERKQAEQALVAERTLLRTLIDALPDVVFVKDTSGRYTICNAAAVRNAGLTREEDFVGKSVFDVYPRERAEIAHADDLKTLSDRPVFNREESGVDTAGNPRWYLTTKVPLHDRAGNVSGMVGISRDITERKQAEEAFRKSQELLRAVADNSSAIIWVKDLDGRYLLINGRYEEVFHQRREEIVGKTDYDLLPKEQAEIFRAVDREALAAGTTVQAEEEVFHDDGTHSYLLSVKCPLRDDTGKPYALCGISTDITERKLVEKRLGAQFGRLSLLHRITRAIGERQDLHSIFQVVVRSLEDDLPIDFGCVCLYEPATNALTVTSVGVKSLSLAMELALTEQAHVPVDQNGLSRCVKGNLVYEPDIRQVRFPFPQRLVGAGLGSFVAAPLLVESKVFGVVVAARRAAHSFDSSDCEFLRQLSEHVALAAHQAQIYGALQQAYTDLRQSQYTIMQQERLRALGQMASGIAHDINNAISPVALYTESLLEREPGLSARARDYLTTIQRAIDDVAQTVTRMREFYRPRETQLVLARIDINRIVQQVVDLTRARWSDVPQERGIVIGMKTDLADDLPNLMGAEGEIRDALTNLIFNAVDAMPEGGMLTLRTRSVRDAGDGDEEPRGSVCVEVGDTGIGMDEDTRRRCLEPFFTTKGERGTGLGLAMVYGMVQRHSAELEIESETGKGTTVRLVFPVSTPVTTSAVHRPAPRQPLQRLRILVIDDDPLLIKSLRDTLEGDGHIVTSQDGGQAGIDAFLAAQKRGEAFAVVITDLGMPYVDGRKVAAAVRAASPATPIILLTGWGQRLMADNDVPPQVARVLSKPPKLHELRAALAELTVGSART